MSNVWNETIGNIKPEMQIYKPSPSLDLLEKEINDEIIIERRCLEFLKRLPKYEQERIHEEAKRLSKERNPMFGHIDFSIKLVKCEILEKMLKK